MSWIEQFREDGYVIVRKMNKVDWMDRVQLEARERELGVKLMEENGK